MVASLPAQWQRPDCQRDCQRHRGLPRSVARRVVSSGTCGIQRRRAQGKTNREIKLCLVRYVARQLETNPRLDAHGSVIGADSSTKQRRLGGRFAPVQVAGSRELRPPGMEMGAGRDDLEALRGDAGPGDDPAEGFPAERR
jgi:hypothetical protein